MHLHETEQRLTELQEEVDLQGKVADTSVKKAADSEAPFLGLRATMLLKRISKILTDIDAVAKAANTVVNSTDSKLATNKTATKLFKQAVAEPIMAGRKAPGPTRRDHHEA